MNKQLFKATALACLMGLTATAALAQNVAIVNGKAVPKTRLDALISQIERSGRPVTPDMQGQLREELIAREIFMQEADKRGLAQSEDYRAQMEMARQSILIRELFGDFQKANPVTDAEMKAEYDKFASANSGKEYKARHILVEKEDQAKAIIASLKKKAKFEDIAKKQSKDPGSGANGGDLDWASPDSYVPEFGQALTKLAKGQITETPVKTQFGWHVIRLDDVRSPQFPAFDQVKPQLKQQMEQQRLAKFQEELRAKAKIE
jgi:peptidyl-prolyl cis-trans isomerase C